MKLFALERLGTLGSWRFFVNLWTAIFFLATAYDALHHNILAENEVLLAIAAIYTAFLAIYSAEKEFRRWHHMHSSIHPGELYVIIWTVLVLSLILFASIVDTSYHIPIEVSATYIAVIGILAITRESKNFYSRRRR